MSIFGVKMEGDFYALDSIKYIESLLNFLRDCKLKRHIKLKAVLEDSEGSFGKLD